MICIWFFERKKIQYIVLLTYLLQGCCFFFEQKMFENKNIIFISFLCVVLIVILFFLLTLISIFLFFILFSFLSLLLFKLFFFLITFFLTRIVYGSFITFEMWQVLIFKNIKNKNIISYSVMIQAYRRKNDNNSCKKALKIFYKLIKNCFCYF